MGRKGLATMTVLRIAAALCLALCVVQGAAAKEKPLGTLSGPKPSAADMLQSAMNLISSGEQEKAIADCLDVVLLEFNDRIRHEEARVYSARTKEEALYYTTRSEKKHEKSIILNDLWANALYLKAYALIDLGRLDEAVTVLEKAVEISPKNAQVLAELGFVHQLKKEWDVTLDWLKEAAEAAETYSPENVKNAELSHAWRGMGYVLVEQGKLRKAEKIYKKCLKLDENDKRAKAELEYIAQLKADKN